MILFCFVCVCVCAIYISLDFVLCFFFLIFFFFFSLENFGLKKKSVIFLKSQATLLTCHEHSIAKKTKTQKQKYKRTMPKNTPFIFNQKHTKKKKNQKNRFVCVNCGGVEVGVVGSLKI